MPTFHDYTQLIRISQRRITAAWHDLANETLHVTPTVARQAAEGIIVWDMERSIRRWQEDLEDLSPAMTDETRMITQVKIWWAKQWLHPDALYRVRVMSAEEQRVARELVKAIPRAGFTCHPSEVTHNPDTWIICEALATGGQVLVTRNLGTIRRGILNDWVRENQNQFGFRNSRIIVPSDEWLRDHLGGLESEESRAKAAKLALAAFWPEDETTDADSTVAHTADHAARLRYSPFGECMREAEGALIAAPRDVARAWAEEVRRLLPHRMRAAEHSHPRFRRTGREP